MAIGFEEIVVNKLDGSGRDAGPAEVRHLSPGIGFSLAVASSFCVCVLLLSGMAMVLMGPELARWILPATGCFVMLLLLAAGILRIAGRLEEIGFAVLLFGFVVIGKLAVVAISPTRPFTDFRLYIEAARAIVAGDYGWNASVYWRLWGYNTGIALWEAGCLATFGDRLWPIQAMNVVFMGGTAVLVYAMARRLVSEQSARWTALCYAFYPEPFFLAPVLSNEAIATFFFMAGVWILLRAGDRERLRPLAAGALVAVGQALRPVGPAVFAGLLALGWARRAEGRSIAGVLSTAAAAAIFFAVLSASVSIFGVNPSGLRNRFPLWKLVVGIAAVSDSPSDGEMASRLLSMEEPERDAAAWSLIRDSVTADARSTARTVARHQKLMWGDLDNTHYAYSAEAGGPPLQVEAWRVVEPVSRLVEKEVYLLVFLAAAVGLANLALSPPRQIDTGILCAIVFASYFAIHLIVEVQQKYRYFAMPFVFILSAPGWPSIARVLSGSIGSRGWASRPPAPD